MEKTRKKIANIVTIIIVAGFLAFIAYTGLRYRLQNTKQAQELPASEIRQYEGKNLSSIKDFQENSIKGPQHVDRNSYQLKIKGLTDGEHRVMPMVTLSTITRRIKR